MSFLTICLTILSIPCSYCIWIDYKRNWTPVTLADCIYLLWLCTGWWWAVFLYGFFSVVVRPSLSAVFVCLVCLPSCRKPPPDLSYICIEDRGNKAKHIISVDIKSLIGCFLCPKFYTLIFRVSLYGNFSGFNLSVWDRFFGVRSSSFIYRKIIPQTVCKPRI